MVLAGDEMGRTQGGNNNAYCQDNGISWIDWELDPDQRSFLDFVERGDRLAAQSCHLLAPAFPHRPPGGRRDFQGHHLVHAYRYRDD